MNIVLRTFLVIKFCLNLKNLFHSNQFWSKLTHLSLHYPHLSSQAFSKNKPFSNTLLETLTPYNGIIFSINCVVVDSGKDVLIKTRTTNFKKDDLKLIIEQVVNLNRFMWMGFWWKSTLSINNGWTNLIFSMVQLTLSLLKISG